MDLDPKVEKGKVHFSTAGIGTFACHACQPENVNMHTPHLIITQQHRTHSLSHTHCTHTLHTHAHTVSVRHSVSPMARHRFGCRGVIIFVTLALLCLSTIADGKVGLLLSRSHPIPSAQVPGWVCVQCQAWLA